jgi:molybdopterin-guanine dinucleotide biosynthesis protein A
MNDLCGRPFWPPVFAICGWSGSGKTWLLERLIPRLRTHGLSVAVVKHDAHRLELDKPGKDTDRLWKAGACAILAHDAEQSFLRAHKSGSEGLSTLLERISIGADIVLAEGHKATPLPKLWLEHPKKQGVPPEVADVVQSLPWGEEDRVKLAEETVMKWLAGTHAEMPVGAGILVGGQSRRMGKPKSALRWNGNSILEHLAEVVGQTGRQAVVLGQCEDVPDTALRLSDVPGAHGPLGGMLSAMRWAPDHAWWFLACDMPLVSAATFEWLRSQRRPGAWAVIPSIEGKPQPLCAIYEPQARFLLENALHDRRFALRDALDHPKVRHAEVPEDLAAQWTNCNTPEEWQKAVCDTRHRESSLANLGRGPNSAPRHPGAQHSQQIKRDVRR